MLRSILVCAIVTAGTLALGCENTDGADAQAKANAAQATANVDIAKAKADADKKMNAAQADADKKIADLQASFSKTREDFRHSTQTNLDELDKKLAGLDAKAKTATGKAKVELDATLPRLHTQRDAFATSFKTIDTTTATTWDAAKMRLDKEWTDLKAAVDKA